MALKATTQRFGTTARQRNAKRSPQQQFSYYKRTYGITAALAWQRAFTESAGSYQAASLALAPYRYFHR